MSRVKDTDIWFDFSNPPHVNLFKPLLKHFNNEGFKTYSTAREFVETIGLLKKYNIEFELFGMHGGANKILKVSNLLFRNYLLYKNIPNFKLSISSSFEAPQISWLKKRPSIIFDDNEIAPNWLYSKFVTKVFFPSVIPTANWKRVGIDSQKLMPYNGFKENIYIADYTPDPNFLSGLPFDKYVVVRPENIFAAYVPRGTQSIVPKLIYKLSKKGFNILYLPRYEIDRTYVNASPNIFIPDKPLNGLDVCYYSDAVLTGAGTFAREAACLGVPSVSFFAGKHLLTVDQSMIKEQKMFFSRDVSSIIEYLLKSKKNLPDMSKSRLVKKEVIEKLYNFINT